MQPKIIFLGTGGDSIIVGKQVRASGGIVVMAGGHQLHIDPGPGALVKASEYGVNLRENTAVLVSNTNLINCNDANIVIDAMTYGGLDINGVLIANSAFINGDEKNTPYLAQNQKNFVERVLAVKPDQKIGIENIDLRILKTNNSAFDSVGFKIFTPEFVLSYSSDTAYSNTLAEQYAKSDILILNVSNPLQEKSENCLNREDAVKIVSKVKPRLTVITHFGKKMIEADPLYEAREIQKATGCQVIAANDGMIINPVSYSASIKQKTLNLYPKGKEKKEEPITFKEIKADEEEPEEEEKPEEQQETLGN